MTKENERKVLREHEAKSSFQAFYYVIAFDIDVQKHIQATLFYFL